MTNILIVEKELNYCIELINIIIQNNRELRLSAIATTASDALNFIKSNWVDIILINAELFAKLDTKYIKNLNDSIIVLTDSKNEKLIKNYTFSYTTFNKEDDINILNIKINDLIINAQKPLTNKKLRTIIEKEILYLGYNPAYKGFNYLIETIFILSNLEEYSADNLSKDIYPIVAKKFNTSPSNIKYNIRNATEAMYYDCPESKLSNYLGFDISTKPKTKTIICAIENNIRKKTITVSNTSTNK